MYIVLTVGHQNALAVIPTALIDLKNFTLRNSLMNLSQRLEALLKQRNTQFDFTVLGARVELIATEANDADATNVALIVNTIADVLAYAREMCHDVVRFSVTSDIEFTVRTLHELWESECQAECCTGIHRLRIRECHRIAEMLDEIQKRGVTKPEIFW